MYMSSTLIKVMLFIPWHPISLYWRGTLSHTDSQFLYTGTSVQQYRYGYSQVRILGITLCTNKSVLTYIFCLDEEKQEEQNLLFITEDIRILITICVRKHTTQDVNLRELRLTKFTRWNDGELHLEFSIYIYVLFLKIFTRTAFFFFFFFFFFLRTIYRVGVVSSS